jgi:hypothetical protein
MYRTVILTMLATAEKPKIYHEVCMASTAGHTNPHKKVKFSDAVQKRIALAT